MRPLRPLVLTCCILATLAFGQSAASAAQPPPEVVVHLVNPVFLPAEQWTSVAPGSPFAHTPKVGDLFDGTDETYRVVAETDAPHSSMLEAYLEVEGANEMVIGWMEPVGTGDTWSVDWDIPDGLPQGPGTVGVRAYVPTFDGLVQAGTDEVDVDLRHPSTDSLLPGMSSPSATVAVSSPSEGGPLGFYKGRGGTWRTVVQGTASPGTAVVRLFYSTSTPGQPPAFRLCGSARPAPRPNDAVPAWFGTCSLDPRDEPEAVSNVGVLATSSPTLTNQVEETTDVARVVSYRQDVGDLQVKVTPLTRFRVAGQGCISLVATVIDAVGNPVQGANVDVEVSGPDDRLGFVYSKFSLMPPDVYPPSRERAQRCSVPNPDLRFPSDDPLKEGVSRVPGNADLKTVETLYGSGLGGDPSAAGATAPGAVPFDVFSPSPGYTTITAWVDDAKLVKGKLDRPLDDDRRADTEASGTAAVRWFSAPPAVELRVPDAPSAPGACTPVELHAMAGTDALAGFNVDLHLSSGTGDARFCRPPGAGSFSAPGSGEHRADGDEGVDETGTRHVEGSTTNDGTFYFGVVSGTATTADILGWIDEAYGTDDDVLTFEEPSASASVQWK